MLSSLVADLLFWAAVTVCAFAQAAIVRSALVAHHVTVAPGTSLPPLRRAVEVAWTVVPAVALAALLVFTWRAMHTPVARTAPRPMPLAAASAGSWPAFSAAVA